MAAEQPNRLTVTFDEQSVEAHSVSVDGFTAALKSLQDTVRLLVEHLGGRASGPGRPARWVRDQSTLRLTATGPGSFAATLALEPPPDGQPYLENFEPQALDALLLWDGRGGSTLPSAVTDKLYEMPSALPENAQLWLGSVDGCRRVNIRRITRGAASDRGAEDALLRGCLKEVNWDKLTAQLHDFTGSYVRLRFDAALHDEMRGMATEFVEVRGLGRLNSNDEWTSVQVERIRGTRSGREPFDLESVLNGPDPKLFDPDQVITASEPFVVRQAHHERGRLAMNGGRPFGRLRTGSP